MWEVLGNWLSGRALGPVQGGLCSNREFMKALEILYGLKYSKKASSCRKMQYDRRKGGQELDKKQKSKKEFNNENAWSEDTGR